MYKLGFTCCKNACIKKLKIKEVLNYQLFEIEETFPSKFKAVQQNIEPTRNTLLASNVTEYH